MFKEIEEKMKLLKALIVFREKVLEEQLQDQDYEYKIKEKNATIRIWYVADEKLYFASLTVDEKIGGWQDRDIYPILDRLKNNHLFLKLQENVKNPQEN